MYVNSITLQCIKRMDNFNSIVHKYLITIRRTVHRTVSVRPQLTNKLKQQTSYWLCDMSYAVVTSEIKLK